MGREQTKRKYERDCTDSYELAIISPKHQTVGNCHEIVLAIHSNRRASVDTSFSTFSLQDYDRLVHKPGHISHFTFTAEQV